MFRKLDYKWLVAIAFVVAMFIDILDTTIVFVALPRLGVELGAKESIEWVATGYLLSLAMWIPASGWLGDRFGTKRIFVFALIMFTAASALCGAAQSIDQLIIFRVLQGVGGGMLTPVGTAMLYRAFPPAERARASAVLTIPIVIAPALGPVLGGLLVTYANWRWIFYINLPIGMFGVYFSIKYLKEEKQTRPGSFDVLGFLFAGAGLALVLYGLERAPHVGWTTAATLLPLLGGIASFVALIIVELKRKEPMLHFSLFRDRMFRLANIIGFLVFGGFIAGVFLLPFYVQNFRQESALISGLVQLPQAIGVIFVGRIVAIKYPKIGPKRFLISGVIGATTATVLLTQVGATSPLWFPALLFFVRGLFMAQVFIPLNAATFSRVSPRETGNASALYQTTRQIGSSLGIAAAATILFSQVPARIDEYLAALPAGSGPTAQLAATTAGKVAAFHDAVIAASIMAACGLLAVIFVRDSDAAPSMAPKPGDKAPTVAHD